MPPSPSEYGEWAMAEFGVRDPTAAVRSGGLNQRMSFSHPKDGDPTQYLTL